MSKNFYHLFDLEPVRGSERILDVDISANTDERAEMAETLGLEDILSMRLHGRVASWKKTGACFEGRLSAHVKQTCIITLEPLDAHIEEDVSLYFLPEAEIETLEEADRDAEDAFAPENMPETIPDEGVNFGQFAYEYLSLSLDPYPRGKNAELDSANHGAHVTLLSEKAHNKAQEKQSPFAALEALKKRES